MIKSDLKFTLSSFVIWRILLFVFLYLAISIIPLQKNFLGGGLESYLKNPYIWSWVNFDGEHYLSIAQRGYQPLTYFFFPVYPLIVKVIASFINKTSLGYALVGLMLSHSTFIIGLIGLIRLIKLDFKKEIVKTTVILLLLFPTSFYFASFYTESLFFALAVWSFYFARKGNWIYSGLLGGLATGSRLVGIALVPALIVEAWIQWKKSKNSLNIGTILGLMLIPAGIFIYMYYLNVKTGDPLEFFHSVGIFGQQRSASLVLLPQVFYRYIFKILPNVNYDYFPVIFSTLIEFSCGILFLALSILSFYKLRFSYAVYLAVGYLIPTLSGSFSSFPRYVLVLFPAFILGALYLERYPKLVKIAVFSLLFALLGIATALFTRGYWVS